MKSPARRHRRQFRQGSIEPLETRRLLASDWQNPVLRCDVDSSTEVTVFDALLIINSLERSGPRELLDRETGSTEPFYDVSGDQTLSPLDVLVVINAIGRSGRELSLAAGMNAPSDPNSNGVVLSDTVAIGGQTAAYASVMLASDQFPDEPNDTWSKRLGASGEFSFDIPLEMGINRIEVKVLDEMGREQTIYREVRRGDIVTDWNAAALNVVREWSTTSDDPYEGRIVSARPPEVARNLAMIHAAMFDAINAVEDLYQPYVYEAEAVGNASAEAAAATAAHAVASSLYNEPDELAVWNATLSESLDAIPDDAARANGVQLGTAVATTILDLRQDDGSDATVDYVHGSGPGAWQRTLPGYVPALLPQWPGVTPFVIDDAVDFRVAAPPSLESSEYATNVDEVMRLGSLNSTERTADQTEIAVFWADGGGTATPPGHWNRIATDVINQETLSLIDSARSLALLNLALADAGIAAWDSKYAYDLWRPIDAIRLADTDGNQATQADADWLPLLPSPPFPTYTSGHSTFSGAAGAVLTSLFGENYAFETSNDPRSAPGQQPLDESEIVTRSFTSFDQAANEAGRSRIYGGIHFSFDDSEGLSAGRSVGLAVVGNSLSPL